MTMTIEAISLIALGVLDLLALAVIYRQCMRAVRASHAALGAAWIARQEASTACRDSGEMRAILEPLREEIETAKATGQIMAISVRPRVLS